MANGGGKQSVNRRDTIAFCLVLALSEDGLATAHRQAGAESAALFAEGLRPVGRVRLAGGGRLVRPSRCAGDHDDSDPDFDPFTH